MGRKLHPAAELAAYKTEQEQDKGADQVEQDDKCLRLAAEFDNYKKRTARQFAEIVKNANEDLILDLLSVLDDFDRALKTVNDETEENRHPYPESVISGMRLIYDKLMNALSARGLKRFDPVGQPFDPQFHDAVMQMPSDKEEGEVIDVISSGYMLNDKVIRHAKVIVASSRLR